MDKKSQSGGIQKVSENAYFIVDFKESVLAPNVQSSPMIHYGWTPGPGAETVQEDDEEQACPIHAAQIIFG